MSGFLAAILIGVFFGSTLAISLTEDYYQEDIAIVTLDECTINKPSGTTCVYEGGYVAKEVK